MSEAPFLTAKWHNLLMVSFVVDPGLLTPLVPEGTDLDFHDGRAYASVVAFQFLDTRVLGFRIPFHVSFEELNLRFYVRRIVNGEVRRAVVFVREVVPRAMIALVARLAYNEPYRSLPMRHAVSGDPPQVSYAWRLAGAWQGMAASAMGPRVVPSPEDHRSFITEHYWGYTRQRNGSTLEYRVTHPRWGVWNAELAAFPDVGDLYGEHWAAALTHPASVLIADGSAVEVFRGRRITTT